VKDGGGQKLADVYYEGRRSAAKLLGDEVQRIAGNIAKLPGRLLDRLSK
jgi:hypothetical protein